MNKYFIQYTSKCKDMIIKLILTHGDNLSPILANFHANPKYPSLLNNLNCKLI